MRNSPQIPKKRYVFVCGCSGILPKEGESNKFARWGHGRVWVCRVAKMMTMSKRDAKVGKKYVPADSQVPHSVIRKLMKIKLCWYCRRPLKWILEAGKTPHLHHNHETGEIHGFTHSFCNPRALYKEIDRLKRLTHVS